MRFSSIPATEKAFRQTGNQGEYTFTPVDVPIPGEDLRLKALFCKPVRRSGYFHAVEHPKQRVVLHFTAGNLRGDMSTLTRQDFHVSVAFVIARDGTIYQLFPSKFWSGHIGPGLGNEKGTGNAQDKATIGIELSNYGFVTERQGHLETIYSRQKDPNTGKIGPADIYCSLDEQEAYQKINTPFRGQVFYPTHTDEQYESLVVLLRYLTAAWKIPRQFMPEATRFQTTNDVLTFKGIVSHVNYRSSGKWDIGPAFDWDRVIAGVQALAFAPTANREVEFALDDMEEQSASAPITSEDALEPLLPQARDASFEDEDYEDAIQTADVPENRNLYALVVGINDYRADLLLGGRVTFPALRGCVADADKMVDYLAEQPGFETHIERLTDQQATKAEIVRQFRNHLGQAGPDDTVLFYFSGHGTQEMADDAWEEETDGRLECLACYYDHTLTDEFLLADKELRYLINELWADKKPHILTIFDCCHSGDNTRAVEVAKAEFPHLKPVEKRIPFAFDQRDWSKFVFADTLSLDQLKTSKTTKSLPEGVHVSLSACEAHESAVEVGGEGVFTKALINILKSTAGSITYHDLQSRVRAYLRNVFEQQPRFRVANGSAGMLYRTFLGGSEQLDGGLVGTITHNKAGWSLDKGAIQGIGATHEFITGVGEGPDGRAVRFRVKTIFPDYTVLTPDAGLAEENVTYKASIDGLMAQKIRVGFELEDISREDRVTLLDKVMGRMKSQLTVVDDADEKPAQATRQPDAPDQTEQEPAKADYVVRGRKGQYYLTYPIGANDADDSAAYRPLVMPVDADDDDALNVLASDLSHIARWEYIRQLENQSQNNSLPRNPLAINVKRKKADGSEEPVTLDGQDALLDFEQVDDDWTCPLRVDITNTSEVDLYISALYLSMGFESYLSLLPDDVFKLEKGKTIALKYKGEPVIPFHLNGIIPLYNWPERIEHLKFIASTELYDAAQMQLEALPDPPTLDQDRDAREKSRGPGMIGSRKPKVKGWTTQRVDLHWQNPTYNQVDPATIEAMMNQESLMDFALGLYFENKTDDVVPAIQLKAVLRDLTANMPLREKGLLGDLGLNLANKIARFRRNRRYEKALKQNPNGLKIVAEGDSWFQHPLVTDTIDHLATSYPVFCVSAAGDTLRNITMAKGTPPVEEYIQAINEQHPDLFILSGGGNDILGEQFRRYIKADVATGSAPSAYLEDLLTADLNSLQTMYRSVFQKLKDTNPNLKVLVHGYDYIIPLSVTNKGWLGRYMIEKGISSHEVRKSILKHILTEFNARMKAVAGEFADSVSYIETPGTVPDNEWYDEIHPNGEGFARVADKFKTRIEELMKP